MSAATTHDGTLDMADDSSYILDISGLGGGDDSATDSGGAPDPSGGRNWIGVQFDCCGAYLRIYRNRQGTAYEGYCPRCSRPVRVKIGPGGSEHRLFRAS